MISDSRSIPNGSNLRADVIIIGAGAAGITLAAELQAAGVKTILLESGGNTEDRATNDLYRGQSTGIPYEFGAGCRSRYLGGSTNCWGGWCRPFDSWDFEQRDWVPNSGWPINADQMAGFYRRTHDYLDLGPFDYDIERFVSAINRPDVQRIPLNHDELTDSLAQFSPPTRMAVKFRDELRHSKLTRVFLNANVTEIACEQTGHRVEKLKCRTLAGQEFSVTGRLYVLAAGGIENARLLLASNSTRSHGIGNEHDLVGRYFMDHPRMYGGVVNFRSGWVGNRLFDFKYHLHSDRVAAFGTQVAGAITPTLKTQRQEKITNSRVWFSSRFVGDDTRAHAALADLLGRLRHPGTGQNSAASQVRALMRHPLDASAYLLGRVTLSPKLTRQIKLQAVVEPDPNPASRITLSTTQKDALGMPRVQVHWQLSSLVRRTFDRTFSIVADELAYRGIADVERDPELCSHDEWPGLDPRGTWHHMGTTRMHDSARLGVVDPNCKVHSTSNLFIAGSSVFPTASANFPTQTLVALAIRLAEHLVTQMRPGDPAQDRPQHRFEEVLTNNAVPSQSDTATEQESANPVSGFAD